MSINVDTTVTVWKYSFNFLYLLLRVHDCRTHVSPVSLDNKSAWGNMAELIQANHHYAKCQLKDSRPHSYRPTAIRQQGTLSYISWRSVLLVEKTGGSRENHWTVASHWQTWSHNVVHLTLIEIRTHNISGDI